MTRKSLLAVSCLALFSACAEAPTAPVDGDAAFATAPKGQQGREIVTGKYTSLYAYDASGAYYWDLGDGRVYTSIGISAVEDLDEATLTECVYQVHYRGSFGSDPYLDNGWIINNINCQGAEPGTYNSLIVHETDPRYRGTPENAIWGTWEYQVDTWFKQGNMARPQQHVGG